MSEDKTLSSGEIDFKGLLLALWDGRWLVLSFVVVAAAVSCLYLYQLPNNFSASIQVRPILSYEAKKYVYTADKFFPINAKILFDQYLETLQDHDFWREATDNVSAAEKSQFTSLDAYNNFLDNIANSFNVFLQGTKENSTLEAFILQEPIPIYPEIKFEGDDQELYTRVLQHALIVAHTRVKENLIQAFNEKIKLRKLESDFAINDLEEKLQNAHVDYKKRSEAELKFLETKLQNAHDDYEKITNNRIEYLKEQGSIARKLGVAKIYAFDSKSFMLQDIKGDIPFFLRGYEAIEEEIYLLKERKNKAAFIAGLLDLEQQIRAIKQDQILLGEKSINPDLEQQIRAIKQDSSLERAKLFLDTALFAGDNGDFRAAVAVMSGLQIRYKNKPGVVIGVFVFLGLAMGLFVLLVRNVIRQ